MRNDAGVPHSEDYTLLWCDVMQWNLPCLFSEPEGGDSRCIQNSGESTTSLEAVILRAAAVRTAHLLVMCVLRVWFLEHSPHQSQMRMLPITRHSNIFTDTSKLLSTVCPTSFPTRKCRYNFPTKTFSNMKLLMHVPWFMLNTWPSQQVLKVSTLGFQTCLHTTFHISKGAMKSLWCDRFNLTLGVVSRPVMFTAYFHTHDLENAPYEEVWRWNHTSSVNHMKSRIPACSLRNAWSHRQYATHFSWPGSFNLWTAVTR
jgi:hypothetical protein